MAGGRWRGGQVAACGAGRSSRELVIGLSLTRLRPAATAAPSSAAAWPKMQASLLTITNEKPRSDAAAALGGIDTAVPHGRPATPSRRGACR